MAESPSNAIQMVTLLEAALQANVGVTSVTIDGQSISYNRQQAMLELEYWRKQVAKENKKSRFRGFDVSGSW